MPYKDPERQREAVKLSQRKRRAAGLGITKRTVKPSPLALLPDDLQTNTTRRIIKVINGQLNAIHKIHVKGIREASDKARTIGFLCSVLLRALEVFGLEARLERVETFIQKQTFKEIGNGEENTGATDS